MKCKHVHRYLIEYAEASLDQKTQAEVEQHLRSCPNCRRELQEFKQTLELLQTIPQQNLPEPSWENFTSQIMREIRRNDLTPARAPFWLLPQMRMAYVATALVVIVIGGFLAYSHGIFHPLFSEKTERIATQDELRQTESTLETLFRPIASEELVNDILRSEMTLIEGEVITASEIDTSNEMVELLLENLTEEEKQRLLTELYKMR